MAAEDQLAVPTANLIRARGQPALNGWKSDVRTMLLRKIAEVREIHAAMGEQNKSCPVELRG